jgi:hypothetical protein
MKIRRPKRTLAGKKQGVAKRKRKSLAGLMPLEPRVMYDAAGVHSATSHLVDPHLIDLHHTDAVQAAATPNASTAFNNFTAPVTAGGASPSPSPQPGPGPSPPPPQNPVITTGNPTVTFTGQSPVVLDSA